MCYLIVRVELESTESQVLLPSTQRILDFNTIDMLVNKIRILGNLLIQSMGIFKQTIKGALPRNTTIKFLTMKHWNIMPLNTK